MWLCALEDHTNQSIFQLGNGHARLSQSQVSAIMTNFVILFTNVLVILYFILDTEWQEFYPAGTYIVRQGGRGDNFFIIASGRVQITQRLPG